MDGQGEVSSDTHDSATEDYANGNVIRDIHQFDQFLDANFDGSGPPSGPAVRFAFGDVQPTSTQHLGFLDWPTGPSRVRDYILCTFDPFAMEGDCDDTPQQANGEEHGTPAAGILFGDLQDDQIASITGEADQIARSGYAPEAEGYIYKLTGLASESWPLMFDDANDQSGVQIFVESISDTTDDETCAGEDALSQAANAALFENGILLINSAGNDGDDGSYTDCVVNSPGSAIGTFTVGSLGGEPVNAQWHCDDRNQNVMVTSAYGGSKTNLSEGKGRTIIDITAHGPQEFRFCDDGGTTCTFSGTSAASPTVGAAAIDFINMYTNEISSFLNNNPASLAANLLLMGDRTASELVKDPNPPNPPPFEKITKLFDQRFGAGRLRMRMPNAAGLDYPSWYFNGWTCIDHQEVYTYTLNSGNTLSEDMDTLKAVVWWYDRRHGDPGIQIDNIDLVLKETNGNVLKNSASPYDNKERVYYYDVGGKAVKLEISGTQVSADDEGCGTNSMKVYFAVMAEDADRDDVDGPSYSSTSCIGVEPEL
jgi:hypothetical protein